MLPDEIVPRSKQSVAWKESPIVMLGGLFPPHRLIQLGYNASMSEPSVDQMIFLTRCDACPARCPWRMVFLKALGTNRIFLFCPACELALENPTSALDQITLAVDIAPNGIAWPSRLEIEEAGLGVHVAESEHDSVEWEEKLWPLWAMTFMHAGQLDRAATLLTKVINTWHQPPVLAYSMRAMAYRQLGKHEDAALDELA